jgi:uncharacterized protein YtpQ (UPF0354 family)
LSACKADADTGGMWFWIVAAWCATASALAVLHHRLRRADPRLPPGVRGFLCAFELELQRHPQVEYLGLLPGQFACLLRVDGQETPVSMQDLFRRVEAFPSTLGSLVDRLVAEIQEVGLDRVSDHEWGGAATAILPQVRNREWVEGHGRFGDAALVSRPLSKDLAIVYVIDDPQAMVFVCRAHLQRWRRSEEDLNRLALANLQRRAGDGLSAAVASREPTLLQTGDGYDAARVLLLDQVDGQVDGLLVAMPDRDVLWVAREEGQDLAQLMSVAEAMARSAPHPVSAGVFRITGGRLEPAARK